MHLVQWSVTWCQEVPIRQFLMKGLSTLPHLACNCHSELSYNRTESRVRWGWKKQTWLWGWGRRWVARIWEEDGFGGSSDCWILACFLDPVSWHRSMATSFSYLVSAGSIRHPCAEKVYPQERKWFFPYPEEMSASRTQWIAILVLLYHQGVGEKTQLGST